MSEKGSCFSFEPENPIFMLALVWADHLKPNSEAEEEVS